MVPRPEGQPDGGDDSDAGDDVNDGFLLCNYENIISQQTNKLQGAGRKGCENRKAYPEFWMKGSGVGGIGTEDRSAPEAMSGRRGLAAAAAAAATATAAAGPPTTA